MTARTKKAPKVRAGLVKYPGGSTWYYLVRFRGEIKRGDTGCTSFEAAKTWLKTERDSWGLAEQGFEREITPTLAGILPDWLEIRGPVVGEKHREQVRLTILEHLSDIKDTPLRDLTLLDLERVQSRLLGAPCFYRRWGRVIGEKPRSEGGVNTIFKLLSSVWLWAKERKYPVGDMPKMEKLKPQEVAEPVVWPELVPAFLEAVDFVPVRRDEKGNRVKWRPSKPIPRPDDQRLAIRLQMLLGLREDEALGFRWEWMDWRQEVYRPGETKNRRTREIDVEPDLLGRLRKLWEGQGSPRRGLAIPESDGTPHRPGFTRKVTLAAGEAVGLVGLHPHRLRATFATTLWEIGTGLSQIQQMMGHKDPETTLGYIVMRKRDQANAVRKMSEAMGITRSSTTVPPEKQKTPQKQKKRELQLV